MNICDLLRCHTKKQPIHVVYVQNDKERRTTEIGLYNIEVDELSIDVAARLCLVTRYGNPESPDAIKFELAFDENGDVANWVFESKEAASACAETVRGTLQEALDQAGMSPTEDQQVPQKEPEVEPA